MYFVIHKEGTPKYIANIGIDFTSNDVYLTDNIPPYVPQEGKYGRLMYDDERGLYYEYYDIPPKSDDDEISPAEVTEILLGG